MVSKLAMCNQQVEKETNKLGFSSYDDISNFGFQAARNGEQTQHKAWSSPVHELWSHGLADKHTRLHPCSKEFSALH